MEKKNTQALLMTKIISNVSKHNRPCVGLAVIDRKASEMETIVKKILPYLTRRGYNITTDMVFEEPTPLDTEERKGFIDILITCGKPVPQFVIEAKRDRTTINQSHRKQAVDYGKSKNCLFVAVTNAQVFELLNTATGKSLKLNGTAFNRLPSKTDLAKYVIPQLKQDPKTTEITMPIDKALPFRPGLPATKVNHLFKECHNSIRTIEKNEEHAFSDFSKILFLKLLEEKWDNSDNSEEQPPYSYLFHELALTPKSQADRVQTAIKSMIQKIKEKTKFGDVLADPINLKYDQTYLTIVKKLSKVSFTDCDLDTKGAAFEYFVRATLQGKKLGQYFTPRPLVKLMLRLGYEKQILNSLMAGKPFKVLDPACGTCGFLVFAMNLCLQEIQDKVASNEIHPSLAEDLIRQVKEETFYGIDAHEGIACSGKMNMVIAGDGHNNIRCGDSLKEEHFIPTYLNRDQKECTDGLAHLILTNPPFGTTEKESLTADELAKYPIASTTGQILFIQKMISSVHQDSLIVTVIDDGVLNTVTDMELRQEVLKTCRLEYVLSLPEETFKPNKINVKSSVLVLRKRSERDENLQDDYPIGFIKIDSLGYEGSGEEVKAFNLERLISEITTTNSATLPTSDVYKGYNWSGFRVNASQVATDTTQRFDVKYWDIKTRSKIRDIETRTGYSTIKQLNLIETRRGRSPSKAEYVSQSEGYALVVKAGSNISKTGELVISGDYIEEKYFKENYQSPEILENGDILLSSTGEGTLGKCSVYRNNDSEGKALPAIAEGHVTVIRTDASKVCPEFLCDYLRRGFGAEQIIRLHTGSTGLIEIQPNDVDRIVVPPLPSVDRQKQFSDRLRQTEKKTADAIDRSIKEMSEEEVQFYQETLSLN
jgi:type I restriction enzyme M protein